MPIAAERVGDGMQHRFRQFIFCVLVTGVTGSHVSAQIAPTPAAPVTGKLEVKVMLVGADLAVRPVPKKQFRIACAVPVCDAEISLVTSFQGEAIVELPAGTFLLASVEPVDYEGHRYSWSVSIEVKPGAVTRLELSNDNASVQEMPDAEKARPIPTEGAIFRDVSPSVFKVISEAGHGSGFLVDSQGLILTNHHVVAGSDFLAVKVDAKRKYPATLVVDDPKNDIAILRVHPEAVRDLRSLTLSTETQEKPSVAVGERVLAVGSPLATEAILTTGIVSKIEEGVIYSDVNINPGNSGGPLFSMLSEVIGINTFGIQGQSGPGVAGIVRIHLAGPLLVKARAQLTEAPPSDTRLPEASDFRFPPDALRSMALTREYRPGDYHIEAGKMDVQFITPVIVAVLEMQAEKEAAQGRNKRTKGTGKPYSPGSDFYEWRRYTGDYRPVVRVQGIPEIGLTGGSTALAILAGLSGTSPGHYTYKFKTDFERMELQRDGSIVTPIHPGRVPHVENIQNSGTTLQDVAYYGTYEYPPETFRPGAKVVLKIWEQGKAEPKTREVPPALLQRLWADFDPYFRALDAEAGSATGH